MGTTIGQCSTCEKSEREKMATNTMQKRLKTRSKKKKPERIAVAAKIGEKSPIPNISDEELIINSDSSDIKTQDDEWGTHFEIPTKSKIAITSAYLIAKIVYNHFSTKDKKCEFMEEKDNTDLIECILKNILIQGGAARDILIEKQINDLDIMCNTRQLNKIHLQHLKQYHSHKNTQCIDQSCCLWQLYLNKFGQTAQKYDKKMFESLKYCNDYESKEDLMKSYKYIRDCDYTLNAKYLVQNIICNSPEFIHKISCKSVRRSLIIIFALEIVDKYIYNNLNLDEQDFDVIDLPPNDTNVEIQHHERNQIRLHHYQRRMEISEKDINDEDDDDDDDDDDDNDNNKLSVSNEKITRSQTDTALNGMQSIEINTKSTGKYGTDYNGKVKIGHSGLIDIDLPICKIEMDTHFSSIDFSINSMVLSLFVVKEIMGNSENGQCLELSNTVYNNLRERLESKCDEYDVMKDVKMKLLTSTYKTVTKSGNIYKHFWRTIKFGIQYFDDGWKINPNLIKWYNQLYVEWIDNDEWLQDFKMQRIQITQQFDRRYANNLDQYQKMLKLFDILRYNDKLKNALKRNRDFKKKWIAALLKKNNDIIQLFKKNGYPTNYVYIKR